MVFMILFFALVAKLTPSPTVRLFVLDASPVCPPPNGQIVRIRRKCHSCDTCQDKYRQQTTLFLIHTYSSYANNINHTNQTNRYSLCSYTLIALYMLIYLFIYILHYKCILNQYTLPNISGILAKNQMFIHTKIML